MSSCIAGLDDSEVFVDIELVAAFSLSQQGKMATDLLETLEVKQEFLMFFSHSHILVLLSNSRSRFRGMNRCFTQIILYQRHERPFCVISCESVTLCVKLLSIFPSVPLLVILPYWLLVLICTVRFYRPIKWLARGFQLCCSYEL